MRFRNTTTSYGSVAKVLHWLIAVLVLCMLVFGFFLDDIPDDYKGMVYNVHKLTGLTILMLMLIRISWTAINPKPALPARTKWWEKWAERVVHMALYVMIVAMPLAGWIGSSASDKPPHLGRLNLLLPVEQTKPLAKTSFFMHGLIAYFIIALLCVHIGAALLHHFVRKDNVLKRMM